MRKKALLTAMLAVGMLLTGCIEFERQTVSYRYDAKTDTLRIFQHYQGLFAADKKDELSDNELGQLESVLKTQRTFFFSNWILEYTRDTVMEGLAKTKEPVASESPADAAARARLGALLQLLLDNVQVENAGFHLDDKGKLCGTQRVTVTRVSKLIAAGNASIRDYLKAESAKENVSAEDRALYSNSTAEPRDYLQIEGNQIRFRYPITRADYDKAFGPASDGVKQLEEFRRSGTVVFADNEVKWTLGKPADKSTSATLSMSDKPYVTNLLTAVKKQTTVKEKFDAETAATEFLSAAGK